MLVFLFLFCECVFLFFDRKNRIVTKLTESHRRSCQKNLYPLLFPSMSWWVNKVSQISIIDVVSFLLLSFTRQMRLIDLRNSCTRVYLPILIVVCMSFFHSFVYIFVILPWMPVYLLFINCFVKKRNFAGAVKAQPSSGCENGMVYGCLVSHGLLKP